MEETKVVRYDRAKNKIMVSVTQEGMINDGTNDIGHTKNRFEQEYDVGEMKKIYAGITHQIGQIEKKLKEMKLREASTVLKYSEDELNELKAKMAELKVFDQLQQDKQGLDNMEDSLKRLRKDANQLKPVIQKLRKK